MAYSEEFYQEDNQNFAEAPSYPSAFGLTFTPMVIGALCGIAGLALAAYVVASLLLPAWENLQQINTRVDEKKQQIQQGVGLKQKIEAARAELDQTNQQKRTVMALFANQQSLNTLLLDLNESIEARQGQLLNFTPAGDAQTDTANKIKRQEYTINFEGTFDQTLSTLRGLEQLQTLLEVRNLNANLGGTEPQKFVIDQQGRAIPTGEPTIRSTFTLRALLPLTPEELAALAPPPAAPPK